MPARDPRSKIFPSAARSNKLLFDRPLRYSEDIDLVQTRAEPIGPTVDGVRDALSWLGKCQREQAAHSMHLVFKFEPEVDSQTKMKLKVEINTREQQSLLGHRPYPFSIQSDWYGAEANGIGQIDRRQLVELGRMTTRSTLMINMAPASPSTITS